MSYVINALIPFLLLPVLSRHLSPADYGIVAMFSITLSMVHLITGMSTRGAIARQYFDRDEIDFPEYVGNCFIILTGSTLIVSIILFLFHRMLISLLGIPLPVLYAVIFVASANFIITIYLTILQVQQKAISFGIIQFSQAALLSVLSLYFVVGLQQNYWGRIWAQVIMSGGLALVSMIFLIRGKWIRWHYNRDYLLDALKFGAPLVPHQIGGFLMTATGRYLLTHMVGIESTGLYSVGAQIGSVIDSAAIMFNYAYQPWLFGKLKSNQIADKYNIVKLTYAYNVFILVVVGGLALFTPWIANVFIGPQFHGSSPFIFWVALAGAFHGMYFMVTNYVFFAKRTAILAWVTLISGILNVGISFLLVKQNGAIGVAQGMAIAQCCAFVFTWIWSARVYPMPWSLRPPSLSPKDTSAVKLTATNGETESSQLISQRPDA